MYYTSWVSAQKNKNKKNKLSNDEKEHLLKIGFIFSDNNNNFDKMFSLLEEYMIINNNSYDIPQSTIYKGERLGEFVSSMRSMFKMGRMSDYRKEKLQSIGFVWNMREQQWNDTLKWMKEYKDKHDGKIDIPKSDKSLKYYYCWLVDQRMLYNKNKMREDRRKLFEQVVFN